MSRISRTQAPPSVLQSPTQTPATQTPLPYPNQDAQDLIGNAAIQEKMKIASATQAPDVTRVPGTAPPVPMPYPSGAAGAAAGATSLKVPFAGKAAGGHASEATSTQGDEAATRGGLQGAILKPSQSKVKVGG